MTLDITDFVGQTSGVSVKDVPPEVQERLNDALEDLTGGESGPSAPGNIVGESKAEINLPEKTTVNISKGNPSFGTLPVDSARFDGSTGPAVLKNIFGKKVFDSRPDPATIIGLHSPEVGSGEPYRRDSLIGVRPLLPGKDGNSGIPIVPTPFTRVNVGGKLVPFGANNDAPPKPKIKAFLTALRNTESVTATLWHGPPEKINPSGPILKQELTGIPQEEALIKDQATVSFKFQSPQ